MLHWQVRMSANEHTPGQGKQRTMWTSEASSCQAISLASCTHTCLTMCISSWRGSNNSYKVNKNQSFSNVEVENETFRRDFLLKQGEITCITTYDYFTIMPHTFCMTVMIIFIIMSYNKWGILMLFIATKVTAHKLNQHVRTKIISVSSYIKLFLFLELTKLRIEPAIFWREPSIKSFLIVQC